MNASGLCSSPTSNEPRWSHHKTTSGARVSHATRCGLRSSAATADLSENSCREIFFVNVSVSAVATQLNPELHWGWDGASLESVSAFSHDPLLFEAGDFNLYRYVHDNPLTRTDPTGLAEVCGPRVWLYTGWWCVEQNVWDAAMEAAGEVVNCWWKCEVETHKCVGGKLLTATEVISGVASLPGVSIPKLPNEIVNPFDVNKGLLRDLARRFGWRQAELMIRSLSRNRALMIGAKGTFVTTMIVEMGISMKCGYSCGKQNGVQRPFIAF